MTRKPKQPALPPVLPLVAVPYVSPGQVERLRATLASSPEWLAVVDVFAADTTAEQYVALDELRAALLDLIDERPADDPRGAADAPPTDQADDGETAGPMVVFAGMTALEAFEGIAGALGFVRADSEEPAVCDRCHAPARDMCACDGDAVEGQGGAT